MHTIKNLLRNPLDTQLAEKLIHLFLYSASYHCNKKEKTTSLLEEHFKVWANHEEVVDITLGITTQGEYLKDPQGGGCPTVYYQYVKEINFSSKDKESVKKIQDRFKAFLEKNKELPEKFVPAIYFDCP